MLLLIADLLLKKEKIGTQWLGSSIHTIGISNLLEGLKKYFLNSLQIAIFPSNCANRSPTHVLGPPPNGNQAIGCRFFLSSAVNLQLTITYRIDK
jgi:hypothetical protein